VNILPGRDGLVHISKLGRGKRVERVEDVVDLGDELEVRVDDIDQQGKVSLSPVGEGDEAASPAPNKEGDGPRDVVAAPAASGGANTVSFEDTWQEEAAKEFGDLGPAESGGGGDGGER